MANYIFLDLSRVCNEETHILFILLLPSQVPTGKYRSQHMTIAVAQSVVSTWMGDNNFSRATCQVAGWSGGIKNTQFFDKTRGDSYINLRLAFPVRLGVFSWSYFDSWALDVSRNVLDTLTHQRLTVDKMSRITHVALFSTERFTWKMRGSLVDFHFQVEVQPKGLSTWRRTATKINPL